MSAIVKTTPTYKDIPSKTDYPASGDAKPRLEFSIAKHAFILQLNTQILTSR